MRRPFLALMKLYPPGYRDLFADEMAAVFEDSRREWRTRGQVAYLLFLVAELAGLLHGAAVARNPGRWPKRTFLAILPFLAGAIVSLLVLRLLLNFARWLPAANSHFYPQDEIAKLLALAAVSIVLIAGFSVAFVLNLRSLARRRQSKARGYSHSHA